MPVYPYPGSGIPLWQTTLAGIVDHLNANHKGAGTAFQNWVEHELDTVPGSHVDEHTTPPNNNSPLSWYAAYILLNQFPNALAGTLKKGITGGSQDIPKALQGAGEGIGMTPGAQFLSWLGGVNWGNLAVRVGEAVVGIIFLGVGLNALLKNNEQFQNVAKKTKNVAKKLPIGIV